MQTSNHVVQSPEWANFKTAYGTKVVKCGNFFYSKHQLPLLPYFVAYCPKVNPFAIDWSELEASLRHERCVSINFDIPNILAGSEEALRAELLFQKHCTKSPKNTFAQHTVLIDLTGTEEEILNRMHPKHRYNLKLAQKRGVTVRLAKTVADYEVFYTMLEETSVREKYYIHSKSYYFKIWEMLKPVGMCEILIAEMGGKALSAWVLLFTKACMYYPYGGTANLSDRNYYNPGNLLGWEAIKLGKTRACASFDMWGACKDLSDTSDPWWGFTNFKLKFGGDWVKFIASYDYVINAEIYQLFNFANALRWKILRFLR